MSLCNSRKATSWRPICDSACISDLVPMKPVERWLPRFSMSSTRYWAARLAFSPSTRPKAIAIT